MKFITKVILLLCFLSSCTKDRYDSLPGIAGTINTPDSAGLLRLVINEFMASNSLTILNPDTQNVYSDWFEIYNPNNVELDLAGYYVTDSLGNPTKYHISSGSSITKIPAHGYKLIWADGSIVTGPLHASFSLSKSGEAIGLTNPSMVMIDSIKFGAQLSDVSFGRVPDGSTTWKTCQHPTPGATNQ